MSHFTRIKAQFRNRDAIVIALRAIGFNPVVSDAPVHLYGIGGHRRPETAQVIVPRKQITSAANDLGFAYNPQTESYDMIISEFDARWGECAPGKGLGREFQARFACEYAIAEINRNSSFIAEKRQRLNDGGWYVELRCVQPVYEGIGSSDVSDVSSSLSSYEV